MPGLVGLRSEAGFTGPTFTQPTGSGMTGLQAHRFNYGEPTCDMACRQRMADQEIPFTKNQYATGAAALSGISANVPPPYSGITGAAAGVAGVGATDAGNSFVNDWLLNAGAFYQAGRESGAAF